MRFNIRNQAGISNKYLRFAKWKILKLSRRFRSILYSEIYVKPISKKQNIYKVVVKLGVPGPDIVVSSQSNDLKELWSELSAKMKRQLRKNNEKC